MELAIRDCLLVLEEDRKIQSITLADAGITNVIIIRLSVMSKSITLELGRFLSATPLSKHIL